MVNRVILIGNLTRDAEGIPTSGRAMTKMRLATNHNWKDGATGEKRESAEFHNVVCFGGLAEMCANYCTKGRRLYVEGRLRTTTYDDREGNKRYSTEVVAETIKLLPTNTGSASERDADEAAVEPALAVVS